VSGLAALLWLFANIIRQTTPDAVKALSFAPSSRPLDDSEDDLQAR
jgi:hypothetical protein